MVTIIDLLKKYKILFAWYLQLTVFKLNYRHIQGRKFESNNEGLRIPFYWIDVNFIYIVPFTIKIVSRCFTEAETQSQVACFWIVGWACNPKRSHTHTPPTAPHPINYTSAHNEQAILIVSFLVSWASFCHLNQIPHTMSWQQLCQFVI